MAMRRRTRRSRRARDTTPERVDEGTDAADAADHGDDDLEARLADVTPRFERAPTADELRAAFGRRDRDDDESTQPPDFSRRFPAETLFAPTPESDVAPEGEDRSRTTGDYYYDPDDAWGVLGVHPGASWREISAAHRRLAMQHHPDRLARSSPEARAASEDAMREVNVAYSVLRRLTGN